MPVETDAFAPGTPCWADVLVDDLERAQRFYGGLFGWVFEPVPGDAGPYVTATLGGHAVAALSQKDPSRGHTVSTWTTYLATSDAEKTARAARAAGGTFYADPRGVLELAEIALGADAAGAVYGLWKGISHRGASLVGEPGSICWSETLTRDYPASLAFYRDVFGWRLEEVGDRTYQYSLAALGEDGDDEGDAGDKQKGDSRDTGASLGQDAGERAHETGEPAYVAGVGGIPGATSADVPSHWMTYLGVADCDEAAARVEQLGGTVVVAPADAVRGRVALVAGPEGETFALLQVAAVERGSDALGG